MKSIRERLGREWLFCDGGSGTILQKKGLKGGELPELWNLTHPEEIKDLYKGYLNAGADIFNANTFGANILHYPENLEEVITAAITLAKEAREESGREAYITLDMGPTGRLLKPMGDLDFEEAVSIYKKTVEYGVKAGADVILIETMSDSYETKAAVLAAKENSDLPVLVTCTFDARGKMLTGADVPAIVAMLEGLGVDAVGVNCSLGPKEMMPIVDSFVRYASLPIIVNPNAGLPVTRHGMTFYPVEAEEFSDIMTEIAAKGVHVIGGCCGTTPRHIAMTKEKVTKLPFQKPVYKEDTIISSYSSTVILGEKTAVIGERINPTGKKIFQQALRDNNMDYILTTGLKQEDAGAAILDVNVGLPGIDEPAMMVSVVQNLQAVTALPLQLDSSSPIALEKAMRIYNGKPMINSVNGKMETMEQIMPLVKKYGGVLVGLCLDESGIPDTAKERVAIAEKIIQTAASYGIEKKNLVIDGLTMTISHNTASGLTALDTIASCRYDLGVHTILGVSNVSFGLPQRPTVNAGFLIMAMTKGLSCAIINPNDTEIMSAYHTANALLDRDPQCMKYIETHNFKKQAVATENKPKEETKQADTLSACIERGLISQSVVMTKEALKTMDPLQLINEQLIPALDKVGKGFEAGTLYLPQLLMSADAAKAAFAAIREVMPANDRDVKGTMILATVKGDIHDIGKNIVKVMLENYGYQVLDLGKDVPPEVIVEEAIRNNIKLVGLSALMTTTVVSMEETIRLLHEKKPDTKIIVGGAVLTEEYARQIGADAYGKDAMATVRYADSIFLS